jgi:hypothetical protein
VGRYRLPAADIRRVKRPCGTSSGRRSEECKNLQIFVDALREWLGKIPLYAGNSPGGEVERFAPLRPSRIPRPRPHGRPDS